MVDLEKEVGDKRLQRKHADVQWEKGLVGKATEGKALNGGG